MSFGGDEVRAVVQRVQKATVRVEGEVISEIGSGLCVLVGVSKDDEEADADYLAEKIIEMRVFPDINGKMNINVREAGGSVLIVSNFTLYGDLRKGRRPNFTQAASFEAGNRLYDYFCNAVAAKVPTVTGVYGANMDVDLVNDGPVTILLDSFRTF